MNHKAPHTSYSHKLLQCATNLGLSILLLSAIRPKSVSTYPREFIIIKVLNYWHRLQASHASFIHPIHYNQHAVEAIEIIENFNFCLGNAIKYIMRYPYKEGSQDLNKCLWASLNFFFDSSMVYFSTDYLIISNQNRLTYLIKIKGLQ